MKKEPYILVLVKQELKLVYSILNFFAIKFINFIAGRHGPRAGIVDTYEGHQGPIRGMDCHNSQGPIDFSHLFLTSSVDWTVKLWSLKVRTPPLAIIDCITKTTALQQENKPLYSFEDNGDYVYDVAWSPIHPAVFATVDGMGRLDVWNLNQDTEVLHLNYFPFQNSLTPCVLF